MDMCCRFVLVVSFLLYSIVRLSSAHPLVSTSLSSGWSVTPIELQFSEWIAQRGSPYFWWFVQDLFDREEPLASDKESFEWCEAWIARRWDVTSGQVAVWSVLAVEQLGNVVLQNQVASYVWNQQQQPLQEKPLVFAEWNHKLYTHLDTLITQLQNSIHNHSSSSTTQSELSNIQVGHFCPSNETVHNIPLIVLYGFIGRKEMKPWHAFLYSMAKDGKIRYVIRHSFESSSNQSMYLQGYGVQVFIKNTEYLVQDPLAYPCAKKGQAYSSVVDLDISTISDRRCLLQGDCFLSGIDWPTLVHYYSLSEEDIQLLRRDWYNWQKSRLFKEWKPWQTGDIGLSATLAIIQSTNPLLTLERIANNLPLYAPLLAGPWHISDSQAHNLRQILQSLEDWEEQVWLNGRPLSLPWGLLPPTLTNCMDAIALARNLWLQETHRGNLSSNNDIDQLWWNTLSSTNSVRLSLVHLQSPVLFLQAENEMNVLLKDSKRSVDYPSAVFYEYASYLGSLDTLHSLVDVIFLWDPLDTNHLLVVDWIRQVLEQGWPIRIGIALVPSSSTSHGLYHNGVDWDSYVKDTTSHIWYHLASNDFPNEDRKNGTLEEEEAMAEMILIALEYLTTQVPCPIAAYYFLAKWKQQVTVPMDIFTLLSGGRTMAAYEELQWIHLERAFLFAYSHGFSCTSSNHPNYQQVETETAPREIWNQWLLHNSTASIRVKQHRQWANAIGLSHLPMVVVNGIPLSDITSQLVTTLEQEMKNILQSRLPNKWVPRLNPALQGQGIAPYNPITLKEILQHPEYYHCKYFQTIAAAENSKTLATIWIAVDLDSMQGLKLVALALEWLSSPLSVPARIAFLSSSPTIGHSSNQTSRWELLLSMKQLVKNKMQGQDTKNHTPPIEFLSYIPTISDQWIRDYPVFMNGFGYPSHLFTFPTDFDMCCFIHSEYIGEDMDTYLWSSFTSKWLDQSCCSLSFSRPGSRIFSSGTTTTTPRLHEWKQLLGDSYDLLSFHTCSNTSSVFHVEAVLDPLSANAAKAATLFSILSCHFNVSISVLLLPMPYTPLKTVQQACFYRTVLIPRPRFQPNTGQLVSKPSGVFTSLFQNRTLTLSMDTPPKWLIGASYAEEDMDNLVLLSHEDMHIHAEYQLEAILVEGTCMEISNASAFPPQGLFLSLVPWNTQWQTQDTLVMANLGYFQFQTNFGLWNLQIGQRKGITYRLVDEKGYHADTNAFMEASLLFGSSNPNIFQPLSSNTLFLLVHQLQGKMLTLYVVPTNTMSRSFDLVAPTHWLYNKLASKLLSWWNSQQISSHQEKTVHVFSVASGYLYERLIRIMMLSVVKHSSVPVKFWLLKNYLSPNFKKMLPHFAATCGFDYQLVTYRWPAWLTPQTEKQRIMWAYKILFLDVLFPLNLSKVVFVDSDQVVRGDLYELFQLDLHGAPYGYVPFCDSRKQVEGYRFWKQGFWASHLKDQKYHISALYVVDLKRFREMAAGDSLRAIYQRLAQDPNSLSNLDQDLPNFASVPQLGMPWVPIYDLPQEWLWCETWCDDESKKRAKTIDLCNNPMTKEHKLSSAKRIIPEWNALDKEATDIVSQALCGSFSSWNNQPKNISIIPPSSPHEEL